MPCSLSQSVVHLSSIRLSICLLVLLSLSGCGYMWQKAHGTDQLLELSAGMSQEQVRAIMGNPDSILYDENDITIPRYKLWNSHRTADDWIWVLIAGWIGPGTLYPFHPPNDYLFVFINNQLCNWEEQTHFSHGLDYEAEQLAKKVMEQRRNIYELIPFECKKPRVAKYPALSSPTREETIKRELATTNLPIYMPPRISTKIRRLAVLPISEGRGYAVATWLDLALNILRYQHSEIVLVERDLRAVMNEVLLQHSGGISDETTARVGRLVGADTLITYNVEPFLKSSSDDVSRYGGLVTGFVELKLVNVEEGTILFRQRAMAAAQVPTPRDGLWPQGVLQEAHRRAVSEASYFAIAALLSAFGDNPLGLVPDMKESDSVKLIGVLEGSAAQRAGLKKGDRVLAVNGQDITTWTRLMPLPLPASLTIEREGKQREVAVMNP